MLTANSLLHLRLSNQHITRHPFNTAGDLVSWMGAMQAQDYTSSKWAFGVRLPGTADHHIEQDIIDRKIIRTWALRGTLHYVSPEDVHWILDLIRPRLSSLYANYYRKLDLSEAVILKSQSVIRDQLEGGRQLTRGALVDALQANRIRTEDMRVNFLLLRAALDGLICFGPKIGKQFSFVLLDEWIRQGKKFAGIGAVSELASRYFLSHGPATIQDFAWWSGFTLADIRPAIDLLPEVFQRQTIGGTEFIMADDAIIKSHLPSVFLLPAFDEYLVAYKYREHMLPSHYAKHVIGANGLFYPLIVINGKIAGTWRRKTGKTSPKIETQLFISVSKINERKITARAKAVARFYQTAHASAQ